VDSIFVIPDARKYQLRDINLYWNWSVFNDFPKKISPTNQFL